MTSSSRTGHGHEPTVPGAAPAQPRPGPGAAWSTVVAGAVAVLGAVVERHRLRGRRLDGWLTERRADHRACWPDTACAVLLVLMARVPLLERGVGTDRLARWHAMGGRYTVSPRRARTSC